MRVRSYFLIAGSVVFGLAAILILTLTIISWWLSLSRPPFGKDFPAITRWDTLKITLKRTFCLGTCPDYTVEVHGDGTVIYTGDMYVAVPGRHKSHVPAASVHALFKKFEAARFFATFDQYLGGPTDIPTYTVTIAFDGHRKVVEDYGGQSRWGHMPPEIGELENAIDDVTNMRLWVDGQGDVAAALEAEHWDFHAASPENDKIIEAARMHDDKALLRKFAGPEGPPLTPEQLMRMPLNLR